MLDECFNPNHLPKDRDEYQSLIERLAWRAKKLSNHMLSHVQRMPDAADYQRAFEREVEGHPMGEPEKK